MKHTVPFHCPRLAQAGDAARFFGPTERRPSAEQRLQSGERELIDTESCAVGQRATEVVRYVGRVEVLNPATHAVVPEVFGEATVNPYADILEESADPAPELTRRMEALTLDGRPALPQPLARARLALVPVEARVQQPSGRIVPLVLP
ncbi:hypothetical protein [Myxococcus sp. SDU36]|uniref:hypothetical protein n=1 Tax=Myxococcus sp. SDU36 TaxID=2831967 RepID=UPI00254291EC|nr:hypothetical protein [Myxococcus sp. SDU36]